MPAARPTRTAALSLALAALAAAAPPSPTPFPFVLASDFSYLPMLDCYGACTPYSTTPGGPKQDAFVILAGSNLTHVRLRVWVHPLRNEPDGWPTPDYTYANITSVAALAKRATTHGLKIWIDLHLSDVWADPAHQTKPVAWASLSVFNLTLAVATHTEHVLSALTGVGVTPDIVQVGNEVSNGALWGATCEDGGGLYYPGCDQDAQWALFVGFIDAGIRAVRRDAPSARVMIHTDLGNSLAGGPTAADRISTWYKSFVKAGGGDFDIIGLSFYPHWGGAHTTDLAYLSGVTNWFPNKQIFLAETAYPYTGTPDPGAEFPWTQAGQLEYTRAVIRAVQALPTGVGGGVAWWGGDIFATTTGAGWTGQFDTDGVALPSLVEGWA